MGIMAIQKDDLNMDPGKKCSLVRRMMPIDLFWACADICLTIVKGGLSGSLDTIAETGAYE
jgi:hypothetical protein